MTPDEVVAMMRAEAENAGVEVPNAAWSYDLTRREMERDPRIIPHAVARFREIIAEKVAAR